MNVMNQIRNSLVLASLTTAAFALAIAGMPATALAQCVDEVQIVQAFGFPGGAVKDLVAMDVGQGPELFALANQLYRSSDGIDWQPVETPEPGMLTIGSYQGELLVASAVQGVWAWNGSTWRTLDGLTGGVVREFVTVQNRVYARGTFTNGTGGAFSPGLAYWDGTGWYPPTPGGSTGTLRDICAYGDLLVAVAGQNTIGGTGQNIAFFDGTSWFGPSPAAPTTNNNNPSAVGSVGGRLVVFYYPTRSIEQVVINVFDGSSWQYLDYLPSHVVVNDTLELDGTLHAVGFQYDFETFGVSYRTDGLSPGTYARTGGARVDTPTNASSLAALHGTLFVGGTFDYIGDGQPTGALAAGGIARMQMNTWIDTGSPNFGKITALATYGGELVVGGTAGAFGDADRNLFDLDLVARYDGLTFSSFPNVEFQGFDGVVNAITVSGNDLYVGGRFNLSTPTIITQRLVRYDGANWTYVGSPTESGINGTSPSVEAIEVVGPNVYVGGRFSIAGAQNAVGNVAYWNGSVWVRMGSGMNNTVLALEAFGGDIIAAGPFTTAGTANVTGVAKWNGTVWSAFGNGTGFTTLETHNGQLFAAGEQLQGVRRWTGSTWTEDATFEGPASVRQLFSDGNRLYAVTAGGEAWVRIDAAKWTQLSTSATASGNRGGLHAIAAWQGDLWVGGANATAPANSGERYVLNRLDVDNLPPQFTQQPQSFELDEGDDLVLEVAVDAAWEPLTYRWYFEAGPIAGAASATLSINDVTLADTGEYYVVVDSFCGTATSDIATVIVHPPCYPDIDGDRSVGLTDLAILLRSFGLCFGSPGFDPTADINRTNCVDLLDLAQLLAVFGSDCP